MNNYHRVFCVFSAFLMFGSSTLQAQGKPQLSLDDFVPPNRGGSKAVEGPTKKVDGRIEAKDAQSGLNAGLAELLKSPKLSGAIEVAVPSGFAIVAIGRATYNTFENRTATLLSKRSAYMVARAMAQKELVAHSDGLESACAAGTSVKVEEIGTGKESKGNTSQRTNESCKEQVAGVINAYVTYEIGDAPAKKEVMVALASSSRTRQALQNVGGAIVNAPDAKRAFDEVMADIASGVVPPMGARLITSPTTGENYVIGFGSAIVRANTNPAIARRLGDVALKQAEMRARNALVSFLKGDKVYWEGGFSETTDDDIRQFKTDTSQGPPKTLVFERDQQAFLATLRVSEDYSSVTKGQVPPGVKTRSFPDDSGEWAYAIAVYSNEMTARAQGVATTPVTGAGAPVKPPAERDLQTEGGMSEGAANPNGPSGRVTRDDKL